MSRSALALRTEFSDPGEVTEVYRDPIEHDGEFMDHEDDDVLFMIEQEFCFNAIDGTHLYLNGSMRCARCGSAHPSIRKPCGQR